MFHSAIPSWFGYRYQGQLAICYSILKIKEMSEKIQTTNDTDKENELKLMLDKYALEIECFEDFSIRYYNDYENFYYLSAHQVKSGTSTDKIGKEPIFSLVENIINAPIYIDENGIKYNMVGYFHVPTNDITFEEVDIKKVYKDQRKTQMEELKIIIGKQNDWLELQETIKGVGEKNSAKRKIHDKLKKNNIVKNNIKNHIFIIDKIKEVESELSNDDYPEDPLNIEIYNQMFFKSICEIEEKIISLISEVHAQFEHYKLFMKESTIKRKILPQLIQRLTEFIDNLKTNPELDPIIRFKDIYNLIVKVPEEIDFSYEAYRFRINIANGFPNYSELHCSSIIDDCGLCDDNDICNLATFMNDFNNLSVKDVGTFIMNIAVSRDILLSEHQIPSDVEIHETIFKYVRSIEKLKLNKTRVSAYHNKKNYWCTCERNINLVSLKNFRNNLVEVLFEADFLIADNSKDGLDVAPILNEFKYKDIEHMSAEIKELFKTYNNSFTSTKKISVINLNEAKEVLCDE